MNPLPNILKNNNYSVPKCIKEYKDKNIRIKLQKTGDWDLYTYEKDMSRWVNWMTYNVNHIDVLELFSHYDLAKGHVICTGLGFGCREEWILTKPEVTKVTVLERNKHVIEYHKKHYQNDKLEYVCCDYREYVGSCDVLLLDSWEGHGFLESQDDILKCLENIECEYFWAWPLEYTYSYEQYLKVYDVFEKLPFISKEKYKYYKSMRNKISE